MNCKVWTCSKLARTKKCGKKFDEALSKWCYSKLTKWYQNQYVKDHCQRSCKNCKGEFAYPLLYNIVKFLEIYIFTFLICYISYLMLFICRMIYRLLFNRLGFHIMRSIMKSILEIEV